ncbi:lysis system i-spanin subunit Rz [Escherichia coli]|uniref:lysis system i-spanin subunit Rz n=1 Tax=Escherichia coli TaxID=562 RepID=UPI0007732395
MNRVLCVVIIALLVACGALSLGLNHYRDNAVAYKAAPPRLADTAERDYFTLRARLIIMQKQLEGAQLYIREQCLR